MPELKLTNEEKDALKEELFKHLQEINWEMTFTHTTDSIKFLRARKELIEELVKRLENL